jgi:hypothetical protein
MFTFGLDGQHGSGDGLDHSFRRVKTLILKHGLIARVEEKVSAWRPISAP